MLWQCAPLRDVRFAKIMLFPWSMQKFLWLGTQYFTVGFTPTENVAEIKRELCLLPLHHVKP